jgi:hypothetical protein
MPNLFVHDDEPVIYDDGRWYAGTLGHFVALLINAGQDPVVLFRVVQNEPIQDGEFVRRFEVVIVPDGQVLEQMHRHGVERAHKTLAAMMSAGKVT